MNFITSGSRLSFLYIIKMVLRKLIRKISLNSLQKNLHQLYGITINSLFGKRRCKLADIKDVCLVCVQLVFCLLSQEISCPLGQLSSGINEPLHGQDPTCQPEHRLQSASSQPQHRPQSVSSQPQHRHQSA
jgi:hypothetical protein